MTKSVCRTIIATDLAVFGSESNIRTPDQAHCRWTSGRTNARPMVSEAAGEVRWLGYRHRD